MVRTRLALVVLLVAAAGCSSLPGDGTDTPASQDVSITIRNDHDRSYTVAVRTVPTGVEGIAVTYENGSTRTFDVPSLDALPRRALRNATDVVAVGGGGVAQEFQVGPNGGLGTTLENVSAAASVVYFVRSGTGPGDLRGVGVVRCPADTTTDLAITIRGDGSLDSRVTCAGGAARRLPGDGAT